MKKSTSRLCKTLVAAAMAAISLTGQASDITAPTLTASHTWIEKEGTLLRFNLLLDPRDDQGIERLEVREKINATTMPANVQWREAVQNGVGSSSVPWKPEEPLTLEFKCTSMVLQVRAVDTSGNYSEVITRTYKSPFPISDRPDLTPAFGDQAIHLTGSALDCRGLFTADFDGNGRDDLLVLDRTTGVVKVRRQAFDGTFVSNGFTVTAGSITDGAVADFNMDGRPDIAVVVDETVAAYENLGLDAGGVLQFQPMNLLGLGSSGVNVVQHVAVADLTGEGRPEIIISGVGEGDVARIAVLLNNDQFALAAANHAIAPAGASAGRLALADFDGDGHPDVAMLDAAQKQVLIFKNRGNSSFGAADDADETLRPIALKTGGSASQSATEFPFLPLAPQALAVGDVTGDGRPDVIVTMHSYFGTGSPPDIVYRNTQLWQLLENRGGTFQRWPQQLVSQSGEAASELQFRSDVLLQDLNQDRLPELVFTSQFENGIRAVQFMPWLDRQNHVHQFTTASVSVGDAVNPQRLATARFGVNSKMDIVVANGDANQLSWWFTTSNLSSDKALDIIGGASTNSNPNGIPGNNGVRTYTEYAGGVIHYSISCFNNTTTDLTGVSVECPLPKDVMVVDADEDHTSQVAGGVVTMRWNVDIPAGTSVAKKLSVEIKSTTKAKVSITPKISLKQGKKVLASGAMPVVKVLGPDFTVIPTTISQPWSFTFKPLNPPPAGAAVWVQGSFTGSNWFYLNAPAMTRAGPSALEWNVTTANVPAGCCYFRSAIVPAGAETGFSSVFNNLLPPTTALKVTSKSPPKSGNPWTFSAKQTSKAASLTVRFQSTETPLNEGSWTDLPVYSATTRAGDVWTFNTYNVPSGQRYFRAISAAPGWVDSISDTVVGPIAVQASPPGLPPFTHYHVDFKDPATYGQPASFMATCASVPGLKVRFQTRLYGEGDGAWKDLTEGTTTVSGTKWTFKTNYMPVGDREWRPVASAPGYSDNTQWSNGGEAIYRWEVKPAPLPQIPTIFGTFEDPAHDSVHRTGIVVPVSIKLYDFNGVSRAFVQAASPGGAFKEVVGTNMTNTPDTVDWSTSVIFSGTGQLVLRVAVVDKFSKAQTCYSNEVTINVGPGNGGNNGPTIGTFSNTFTQATLKARGSVKIKVRIGDDSQVRYAFVHRMTAQGNYHSTVGQMTRASAANPSDFSCVDGNLADGTYYYRVVAHDYDGNESISSTTGAYVVATPAPPPTPIHLDIEPSSRLVAPTFPATKFNYIYLPQTTSGMVTFNYSGLPAGTNRFVGYRTDLGPNQPFFEQTVTKTSGTLKIKAPWWKESSVQRYTGEGQYRIVCFQGSNQIAHGSGVNTFRVGHAWQTPDTFKQLDWGLFWFKNGNSGLRGVNAAQDDDYFDPDKPTVIYVHGWQPGEVKVGRRESWMRQDPYKDATYIDCCKIWKDQGYNVGIFNWNQFGDGDLLFSQANIYYRATESGLPNNHSMIYSVRNADGSSSRYYLPEGQGGDIEGCTVVDLFLGELQRCLAGYTPSANKEFRMIGHSLGTQVVGRTCDAIRKNPGWGIPLPTRIALLELAQINGLSINGLDVPETQKSYITGLVSKGVAVECYQSTDLQSLLGVNLAFVGDIHDMSAYCRWRPDFIQPAKVGLDVFQKSHNEIVRWYMESFKYNEFPAFTYWAPFQKRDNVGKALSASTSLSRVKAMMGGQYWYEQSEGKNSAAISDDQFERKNR